MGKKDGLTKFGWYSTAILLPFGFFNKAGTSLNKDFQRTAKGVYLRSFSLTFPQKPLKNRRLWGTVESRCSFILTFLKV
jgi:hypothetical protein